MFTYMYVHVYVAQLRSVRLEVCMHARGLYVIMTRRQTDNNDETERDGIVWQQRQAGADIPVYLFILTLYSV